MAARRTNKTHVIRQTTGEKYPTQVVDPNPEQADTSKVETTPSEDMPDLFSQEVTGSEVATCDPERETGTEEPDASMPAVPELLEVEALAYEPVDDVFDNETSSETNECRFETSFEKTPKTDIDETFIEEGALNGSAPLLDAQMIETELEATDSVPEQGGVYTAEGSVLMHVDTQNAVLKTIGTREDVLAFARVAGITAGKHTGEFVPSCPAQAVSECAVDIYPIAAAGANVLRGWKPARKDGRPGFHVQSSCAAAGSDEVQTQALAAVSAACITIFDMMSSQDATMDIADVRPLREEEPAARAITEKAPEGKPVEKEEPEEERLVPTSPLPGGAGTGQPAPAISFIGFQNSGKTTLVERVISNLSKRGLRIGSIKLHGPKGFEIDQPGKDSWRHAQAGSRHVGLISPDQYAEYASTTSEVPVQDLLTHYTDVDLVIVEGLKTTGIPSIVVARSGVDRIRGISSYDLIDDDTLAIACNEVTARGIRAQWDKMRTSDDEMANPDLPLEPPAFLDINDVPEIVSFVMDYLKAE